MKSLMMRLKIRDKIVVLILLVSLLFTIILFGAYFYMSQSLTERTVNYDKLLFNTMVSETNAFFEELDRAAFSVCSDSDLQEFLSIENADDFEILKLYNAAIEKAYQMTLLRNYVSVNVFGEKSDRFVISQHTMVRKNLDYNIQDEYWYQLMNEQNLNKYYSTRDTQNYYDVDEKDEVISCIYRITKTNSLETLGFLIIDLEKKYIADIFNDNISEKTQVVLFDDYGLPILEVGKQFTDVEANPSDYLINEGIIERCKWTYQSTIDLNYILKDVNAISTFFLLIIIVSLITISLIATWFSKKIFSPLEKVIDNMANLSKNHTFAQIEIQRNDEMGRLIDSYNIMIQEIDMLLKKNETSAILKKDAELKALFSQINPHFIYNTLELIISYSYNNENDLVVNICKNMGKMLRYNLESKRKVQFSEEYAHIKRYIDIIQHRMVNRFDAMYYITDETLDVMVIKFILQPFVENIMLHAFENTEEGGMIVICARVDNEHLCIEISDNGKGISKEKIEEILYLEDYYIEKDERIGIQNVNNRLAIEYEGRAEFYIVSQLNKGTTVGIRIPIEPNGTASAK